MLIELGWSQTGSGESRWEITTVESTGPTVSFGLGSLQVAVQFLLELLQGWEAHHSKGVWFLLLGSSSPCVAGSHMELYFTGPW